MHGPIQVTFLGTGTSQGVPVISCDCPVCTSTSERDKRSRTSILVATSKLNIAVDAGPDFRMQMLRNNVKSLDALLLTHDHNDHIIGLDEIRPFNFRSGKPMPIYASDLVIHSVKKRFSYIFDDNPYPGAPCIDFFRIAKERPFSIKSFEIIPIEAMHGNQPVLGFRFGDFTYLTDVRTINEVEKEKARNSKVLVLNALHRKPHHSHLNLSGAIQLVEELAPEKAYFTHISHNMGLHEEVSKELPHNVFLAYDGLELSI